MRNRHWNAVNHVTVSFGEYGAPDFDSRVETVGKAAAYGVMSDVTAEEKKPDTSIEEKKDESQKAEKSEKAEEKASDVPQMSETDKLKAENLTLKTQLEALKIGFKPDCMEDAVVLAENIVKRGDMEISEALQAVAKKYPDWKSDSKNEKSKGGFRIGADSSDDKMPDEDRMREAFGIRKKK